MQDFMHLLILRAEYDGGLHNDPPPGHYKSYPDSAGLSAITATMGRLQNAEYIYLNSENTGVAISSEATITRIGIAENAPTLSFFSSEIIRITISIQTNKPIHKKIRRSWMFVKIHKYSTNTLLRDSLLIVLSIPISFS